MATYDIESDCKKLGSRGKYQLKVVLSTGSSDIGTEKDQYASSSSYVTQNIGTRTFTNAGDKRLRFQVTGKNSSSSGYSLAIDTIRLVKQ